MAASKFIISAKAGDDLEGRLHGPGGEDAEVRGGAERARTTRRGGGRPGDDLEGRRAGDDLEGRPRSSAGRAGDDLEGGRG